MSHNVIVTGKTGEGKTTSFDEIIANSLRFKPRQFVICEVNEIEYPSATGQVENESSSMSKANPALLWQLIVIFIATIALSVMIFVDAIHVKSFTLDHIANSISGRAPPNWFDYLLDYSEVLAPLLMGLMIALTATAIIKPKRTSLKIIAFLIFEIGGYLLCKWILANATI